MKFSSKTTTSTSTSTIANLSSKVAALALFLASLFGVVYGNTSDLVTIGTGDADGDYYGHDVAISGDANTMAVGADYADPGGVNNAGLVRLYGRNGTNWNMFQQINGPAENGRFGYSLDLSDAGSTLAIGAVQGAVYIYDYNNDSSTYEKFHTTPDVDAREVCVSGDGSTVGVTTTNVSSGARIFGRNGNGFQQRGGTFTGYGSDYCGIALSYNGNIVAIGDRTWSSGRGRVGVFRDDNGSSGAMVWVPMGPDITGDADDDHFGRYGSVSITNDGLTVALGAPRYELTNRGLVRVYNHDSTNGEWNQSGSDLVGDNTDDLFCKTAISSDGKYLAVGTAYSPNSGNYVKVLAKNGTNYEMIGEKVTSGEGFRFGFSVDMSADGAAVLIGDFSVSNDKGRAYLFVLNDTTNTPSTVPSTSPSVAPTTSPSTVPSTSPSVAPTAAVSKTDFALKFQSGDTIINFDGTSSDKEIVIKTLISNKVPRDSFEQTILVGTDCQSKFVDDYPDDATLVSISNDATLDVVEGKNIQVTSDVDIDTAVIASKGVHADSTKSIYSEYDDSGVEKAKVEFCIRTDYGKVNITTSDGVVESSINFYKVKIVIDFVLEFGFTSSNVTIEEEEAGEAQQDAVITSNLEACDCPANADSTTECYGTPNAKTYNQNDILSVCVYDPNGNSIITSFKDVELGNGQISTQVIDPDGRPTALASVSKLNEEMAIVNTRIVSAFFDVEGGASPATVALSGVAVIGFKTAGTRKLTNVGLKGARNVRKLQDEEAGGEGTFDVEVLLSDDEQVDGSPGFDVLEYGIVSFVMATMIPIALL